MSVPKFEVGQWVLIRDKKSVLPVWHLHIYGRYDEKTHRYYVVGGFFSSDTYEVIPYEGNENF